AKLAFIPGGSSMWTLSAEVLRAEAETEIYSARGVTTPGTTTTDADAVDERRRTRVSLSQSLEATSPLFDRAEWRLHAQEDDTEQRTVDELTSAAGGIARRGLFTFEQDGLGGEVELQKSLARGHLLTYGVAYTRDRFDQIRDRRDRDLVTGRDDVYRGPLVFPSKYFPESDVEELGVYLQDEMDLLGGRLKLVPGLRYDRYSLDADETDPVYLAGNAGIETPVDLSSSALSPRLGLVMALPAGLSAFGQYARGFRAPAFSSVNSGFTNVASGYTTLPNPDLEPETSATVEAGLRLTRSRGNASLTLFHNRFHDFIESVATGINPATQLLEFQPRNVGEAVISGVELGGEARLGQAWTLRASAALIDGENETTEQPLNSIAPATGVLGLRYVRPGRRWGGELITTLTAAKDEDDVDRTVVNQLATDGSEVVDLTLFFDPTDRISLTVGVFNLFDVTWFAWPDVIGRTEGSPVLDRYTRPGRSFAAAFRLRR
ncbi:MAG TPA: TonB-dependent receptor, partial [Thermoanaerobaculia bacterium]|nr:TonB-dependent receptor [Thermoanaerobaculia bacterium]